MKIIFGAKNFLGKILVSEIFSFTILPNWIFGFRSFFHKNFWLQELLGKNFLFQDFWCATKLDTQAELSRHNPALTSIDKCGRFFYFKKMRGKKIHRENLIMTSHRDNRWQRTYGTIVIINSLTESGLKLSPFIL